MRLLMIGLVLGILIGVAGALYYQQTLRDSDPCLERCGPSTVCQSGQCTLDTTGGAPAPVAQSGARKVKRTAPEEGAPLDPSIGVEGDDLTVPPTEKPFVENEGRALAEAEVDEVVFHHRPDIERCIADARGKGEDGAVKLSFRVDPSGSVAAIRIEAPKTWLAKKLGPCIRGLVEPMRFARAGRSTISTYTFEK